MGNVLKVTGYINNAQIVLWNGQIKELFTDGPSATVFISVERAYKGKVGKTVVIFASGIYCDYSFQEGSTYLIYATRVSGTNRLRVSECSGTSMLMRARSVPEFVGGGEPKPVLLRPWRPVFSRPGNPGALSPPWLAVP